MGYGHAQDLAGKAVEQPVAGEFGPPPVDPVLWWREDVRAALRGRDIGAVYRVVLEATGMSQYRLAVLVGQAQSEVCEILQGRRVRDITVLERIVTRLGIPPELVGLSSYGPDGTYCGEDPVADSPEGMSAEMLRRHVLGLGGVAAFSVPIKGLGELAELVSPAPAPLPSQVSGVDVAQVRDLTCRLREGIHAHGSNPQVCGSVAAWADRLLGVSGAEPVKRGLVVAVAELHTVAGWAGFDAGLYQHAMYHYGRGLELAIEAGDAYLQAVAVGCAGVTTLEHGHPDDGLKMLQLGQLRSWDMPPSHDLRAVVEACALADSVPARVALGDTEAACRDLAKSRQVWTPTRTDSYGDPDGMGARLEFARGRWERAEPLAAASVRRWEGISELRRTLSAIVLAAVHVRVGDPQGPQLAHRAIVDVMKLGSVHARTRLGSLATALESRPGSDTGDLARTARQVATTRA